MRPKVSVIIPTYNRGNYLYSAIRSVLNQTFEDFEIIVVDDASTDNSGQVIEKFEDKRVCYICHKENKGGSVARNTGIKYSRGRFIAFLDDDDLWMPTKLEKQMDLLNKNPEVDAVYTGAYIINKNQKIIWYKLPHLRGNIFADILKKNYVGGCSSVLVRKECFDRTGLFDENLPAGQDYDMWIRLAKHYQFDYVEEPLVLYRVHEKRITTNQHLKLQAEKLIKKKFSKEFKMLNDRKILGAWHFRIGKNYCRCGDMEQGKKEFVKAIINDRFRVHYYAGFFTCFLGSTVFNLLIDLSNYFLPPSFKNKII